MLSKLHGFSFSLILFIMPSVIAQDTDGLVLNAHAMAHHPENGLTYIFGGATHKEVSNKLYIYDGTHFRHIQSKSNPAPRTFPAMAFHGQESTIYIFGGSKVLFGNKPQSDNILNDTWRLKNDEWSKVETKDSPPPRAESTMVYDEFTGKLVLFGGYVIRGKNYVKLNDTWEFYDGNWHSVATKGPSPRNGTSMVYDPVEKRVILFGGSTNDRSYGAKTGETWQWKNSAWTKLNITQPDNIFNSAMAYDHRNNRIVRFGGYDGNVRTNNIWYFEKNQWEKSPITSPIPSARNHTQMVYDSKNRQIIIFGGHDGSKVFGDLWTFKQGIWKQQINVLPKERIKNRH